MLEIHEERKKNKIQIGTKDMAHWSTMTSSYVITDHVLGEVTKTKKLATSGELFFL